MMFIKKIYICLVVNIPVPGSQRVPAHSAQGAEQGALPPSTAHPRGSHSTGLWGSSSTASPQQLSQENGFEDGFSQMGSLEEQRPRQPERRAARRLFKA